MSAHVCGVGEASEASCLNEQNSTAATEVMLINLIYKYQRVSVDHHLLHLEDH